MAATMNQITTLHVETMKRLGSSPAEWGGYLDAAARLYKYTFDEAALIYAQDSAATACASAEIWNKRMGRYINRGSKGIALLDEVNGRYKLRYVFDFRNTHPVRENAREPNIWALQPDTADAVLYRVEDAFSSAPLDSDTSIEQRLSTLVDYVVNEDLDDSFQALKDTIDDSNLSELDDDDMLDAYRRLMISSVNYTVLTRCGFHPPVPDDFSLIKHFNTSFTITHIGDAINTAASDLLRQIELEVKRVDKHRLQEYNALKRESERSGERDNLQTIGGLSDTESRITSTANRGNQEIRPNEASIPQKPQAVNIPSSENDRAATRPLGSDTDRGTIPGGQDSKKLPGSESSAGQGEQSNGMGSAHEHDPAESRGTGSGRGDLQLALFPTEQEQIQAIKNAEGIKPSASNVPHYDYKVGDIVFLENDTPFRIERIKGTPSLNNITLVNTTTFIPVEQVLFKDNFEFLLSQSRENDYLLESEQAKASEMQKSPVAIYKEYFTILFERFKDTPAYSAIRQQEIEEFEAMTLMDEALEDIVSELKTDHADFYDAYTTLPQFSDWMADDIFERTYFTETVDGDLSVDVYSWGDDAPDWAKVNMPDYKPMEWEKFHYPTPESENIQIKDNEPEMEDDTIAGPLSDDRGYLLSEDDTEYDDTPKSRGTHDERVTKRAAAILEELQREQSQKQYDLGFGLLGNGITVWNRLEEIDHDYKTVAHISEDGAVSYREELPEQVRAQIEKHAERVKEDRREAIFTDYVKRISSQLHRSDDFRDSLDSWKSGELDSNAIRALVEDRITGAIINAFDTSGLFFKEYISNEDFKQKVNEALFSLLDSIYLPEPPKQQKPDYELDWQEYASLKEMYPDHVVGVRVGDNLMFYGDDAAKALSTVDRGAAYMDFPGKGPVAIGAFPFEQWRGVASNIINSGQSYLFVETPQGAKKPYEIIKARSIAEYIPIGMEIDIDGKRYETHMISPETGNVLLKDLSEPLPSNVELYTAMPIGYVRQFIEDVQSKELEGLSREEEAELSQKMIIGHVVLNHLKQGDKIVLEAGKKPVEVAKIRYGDVVFAVPELGMDMTRTHDEVMQALVNLPENRPLIDAAIEQESYPVPHTVPDTIPDREGEVTYHVDSKINRDNAPPSAKQPVKANSKTVQVSSNYHIDDDSLGIGGAKTRYLNNAAAIRVLKQLEAENRAATTEEQAVLSKYTGWGAIPNAFDDRKEDWAKEYTELKALLSPEEYESAQSSILNAHYTSPAVIKAIYGAIERMGFSTGNILEPSCGVGNFFGFLPEAMAKSKMYGVELDSITGRIAQKLYPDANISVTGFEKTKFPDDFFDLAIGNIPFGGYTVADKKYDKHNFLIHDYFFAKTLDQVRPGGVIALITSSGTLDKQSPEVRKYIAQRADLLGAVRLPNNAFLRNAGTEVTTDIVFLQKRDRMIDIEPDWVQLGETEDGIPINSYFAEHPEMVLGKMEYSKKMYGNEKGTACIPFPDVDLGEQLNTALFTINAQYSSPELDIDDVADAEHELNILPADPNIRNFSFGLVDGNVYYRNDSQMYPVATNKTALQRIKGLIELRDCTRKLIEYQAEDYSDEMIQEEQQRLNKLYDRYTSKYGRINSRGNSMAFSDDSSYTLLCSLEVVDDEQNFLRKADMFSKRTIKSNNPITSVALPSDALMVSLSEKACVDIGFMASLMGGSEKAQEIIDALQGVIFKNPEKDDPESPDNLYQGWETADEYLSGNVRDKLHTATEYAKDHPEFSVNVDALMLAQPKDLSASEIEVRVGARWVDIDYYTQFVHELLEIPDHLKSKVKVLYSAASDEYKVVGYRDSSIEHQVTRKFGTDRANAYSIIEESLNLRSVEVKDAKYNEKGNRIYVINDEQTAIALQKQDDIKAAFQNWIFKDAHRREHLCHNYNSLYNNTRNREFDGSHLTFPGMNPEIKLDAHQKNGVARILYGGNSLLAHVVGAGKTYTMTAAAMESKRVGLSQKTMIVVPNHLTEQWGASILELYPGANILVSTKKDFKPKNRKKFCSRISTGAYDIVVIGHSQFEKIPLSPERQQEFIKGQIKDLDRAIRETKAEKGEQFTIKQLEKTKKALKTRLERLMSGPKDDVVTFEQLGVDRLYVDEAHSFKNLMFHTKMRNVAGLGKQDDVQKSTDMYSKTQYMDEITNGKGVVFATGTPISNSMVELFTNMRYLMNKALNKLGLTHFDSWISTFGEPVSAVELSPEGTGFRAKTRLKFVNIPELVGLFKQVADIQTADMLNLERPKANFIDVVLEPSEFQKSMVAGMAKRAEDVRSRKVHRKVDNMLKITTDGRKLALDQRLLNPMLPDDPNSKTNACAANVFRIYQKTSDEQSTQMVFCDQSTPGAKKGVKGAAKKIKDKIVELVTGDKPFCVYDDLKQKLIDKGIPANEIAFIHDAKSDTQKAELFAKVKSGKIRVLIGSTEKMGAGTNVQKKLIALHHLDVPWKPSDIEQQEGRILRRGNDNKEVEIYRYITEGTFDAYSWQLLEYKQKFISQIMTGKSPSRCSDDFDDSALSYAEVKALATGDPHFKEKMELDIDVHKLQTLKSHHMNEIYELEDSLLKEYPKQIAETKSRITQLEKAAHTLSENPVSADHFSMTLDGRPYTDKKEAGEALVALCTNFTVVGDVVNAGSYRGFEMLLRFNELRQNHELVLKHGGVTTECVLSIDPHGNITRINNALDKVSEYLQESRHKLDGLHKQVETAKVEVQKPFPREQELTDKKARQNELMALITKRERGQESQQPAASVKDQIKNYAAGIAQNDSAKADKHKDDVSL